MSHPVAAGASEGNGSVGKAIAAAFLVLFLAGPATSQLKFAIIIGVAVYFAASRPKGDHH